MTYEEDKAHFSMWCLMHSPLLLGNDLTKMSEESMEIITNEELIEINQSSYVYQARRVVDHDSLEVWARPLVSTMSGEVVVALLNRTNIRQMYSFQLSDVGLDASKGYTAKDLWTKEAFEKSTEKVVARELPPHGIVVLKLKGIASPFNIFQFADEK
jgi:hypothetical protein